MVDWTINDSVVISGVMGTRVGERERWLRPWTGLPLLGDDEGGGLIRITDELIWVGLDGVTSIFISPTPRLTEAKGDCSLFSRGFRRSGDAVKGSPTKE